ncbi:MAG: metallophosphoesterase [Candidatus Lokiarchaeota archaeon]
MNSEKGNVTRFIHAGDIHLGSHQYRNHSRAQDFIEMFKEILSLSLFYQVNFILIAGDVFNSREILPSILNRIIKILRLFKILDGNFDDRDENIYPEFNFKTRKGGKSTFNDAVIYGNRYLGNKFLQYLPKISNAIPKNDGLIHILIQHLGIEGQMINVPGIKLEILNALKEKVDYLALGHYHKQYTIGEWIFNPGSSDASCILDFNLKRGLFLVELFKNSKGRCEKKIKMLKLHNRAHLTEIIYVNKFFLHKEQYYNFILMDLKKRIRIERVKDEFQKQPVLILILRGIKPSEQCKINKRHLRNLICNIFPFIEVKIYYKFNKEIKTTLKNFLET